MPESDHWMSTKDPRMMLAEEHVFSLVLAELKKARAKFPEPDFMILATGEEFGELCRAIGHLVNPAEPTPYAKDDVVKEAIQTMACLVRLLTEGDHSTGLKPSVAFYADGRPVPYEER